MQSAVQVIVRVRPLFHFQDEPAWIVNQHSVQCLQTKAVRQQLRTNNQKDAEKMIQNHVYNFQGVANAADSSQAIYQRYVRKAVLDASKQCRNMCILAYGQTCSGKTHTILGDQKVPGIVHWVLNELLTYKEQNFQLRIKLSYVEIYNEKLYDLLGKKEEETLKIVDDKKWGCQVQGLGRFTVKDMAQCRKMISQGEKIRAYAQKENHERSSRSHTLLRIYVEQVDSNWSKKTFLINLVDLAGSERFTSSPNVQETLSINKSLFQLSNVISKLSQNSDQHVPYRDSKITRLLESSLSGKAICTAIFCVSPAASSFNETLSTLRLATKAKKIETSEKQQENKDHLSNKQVERIRKKLKEKEKECEMLKEELISLREQLQRSKQNESKQIQRADVLVLLDHQNFDIYQNQQNCKLLKQFLPPEDWLKQKQEFLEDLQELYQSYTDKVLARFFNNKQLYYQVKVQQVCFINLAFHQESLNQLKIPLLQNLLSQFEADNSQDSPFYQALQNHFQELKGQKKKSYPVSNGALKRPVNINVQTGFQVAQKQIKFGSTLYIWGCNKNGRVCEGTNSKGFVKVEWNGALKKIQCGYHHSFVVDTEGSLYGWGKNTEQQIIDSDEAGITVPRRIPQLRKVKEVAAGWGHTIALVDGGSAFSWGCGADGQLGHGDCINMSKPTQIQYQEPILKIYAGHSHSGFIDQNHHFYSFGYNQDYRLLIRDQKRILFPQRVPIGAVVQASLGVSHSAIITETGNLYCGGTGTYGQLGMQLNEDVTGYEEMEVDSKKFDSEKVEKICALVECQAFGPDNKAIRVNCGQNFTLVLNSSGSLFSFGRNLSGRLGHQVEGVKCIAQGVSDFSAGCRHGFYWDQHKNKLFGWGFNMYKQVSPDVTKDLPLPQEIEKMSSTNLQAISCGFFHSAVLLKEQVK